jgi:similar to spore coat protein
MDKQGIALHETIQLHELLTFKNLSLTKSITMSPLVSDSELKLILKQDVKTAQQHIKDLRALMLKSSIE